VILLAIGIVLKAGNSRLWKYLSNIRHESSVVDPKLRYFVFSDPDPTLTLIL
jgi:hypothetical protein